MAERRLHDDKLRESILPGALEAARENLAKQLLDRIKGFFGRSGAP
jgi:hypothetical protein